MLVARGSVAAAPWGDAQTGIAQLGRRKAALCAFLLAPLLMLWMVSLYRPFYAPGRYDLIAFPAFPLLLGLAMGKLETISERGWVLAGAVAAALLVPIGAKLVLYYRTTDDTGFERAARALLARVRDGDVVVFTDLRGLPIIYQLAQLGYRWENGSCSHGETGQRFACRMFPLETEQTPATYRPERLLSTPTAAREDVAAFLGDLGTADSTVHVVFGTFATAQGQLAVTGIDSRLIAELDRAGFEAAAADVPLGMISYRRRSAESALTDSN